MIFPPFFFILSAQKGREKKYLFQKQSLKFSGFKNPCEYFDKRDSTNPSRIRL